MHCLHSNVVGVRLKSQNKIIHAIGKVFRIYISHLVC